MKYSLVMVLIACIGVANAGEDTSVWTQVNESSSLRFQFTQAGVDEAGQFDKFDAVYRFDPDNPQESGFDVKIQLASVNTGDTDRDEILRSDDMFAVKQWPAAHFRTQSISREEGNRYLAKATLTIRDQTREIPFPFTLEIGDKMPGAAGKTAFRLKASVPLKRLDYGVGKGDWAETTWISDEVLVNVDVVAVSQ